ncbi:MAG: hypothetical protein R3C46_16620 [Hyphomonadaceae bacterium]
MRRIWTAASLAIACAAASAAAAQTVAPAAEAVCPGEPMSVYFASGEATLTAEGRSLVERLVDQAIACRAEGIDIITRINTGVDGEHAISLALARLNGISHDFVSRGVSPESIRIAAQPGDDIFPPGMSEVEVIFRKTSLEADDASTRKPPAPRLPSPGSI